MAILVDLLNQNNWGIVNVDFEGYKLIFEFKNEKYKLNIRAKIVHILGLLHL